MYYAVLQRY